MRTCHDNALALGHPGIAGSGIAPATRLPAGLVRRVRSRLRVWTARRRERAYLASLDDFEVSRLGLTLGQRDAETGKAFWER